MSDSSLTKIKIKMIKVRCSRVIVIISIICILFGFFGICAVFIPGVTHYKVIDTYFKSEPKVSTVIEEKENTTTTTTITETPKINLFGYIFIAIPLLPLVAGMTILLIRKNKCNRILREFYNDYFLYIQNINSDNEDYMENLISSISKLKMITSDIEIEKIIKEIDKLA